VRKGQESPPHQKEGGSKLKKGEGKLEKEGVFEGYDVTVALKKK